MHANIQVQDPYLPAKPLDFIEVSSSKLMIKVCKSNYYNPYNEPSERSGDPGHLPSPYHQLSNGRH